MPLLFEEAFHELAVVAIGVEAAQQQLGIGAQGRQWITQLVHHQIQLRTLVLELIKQTVALQFVAEALG